jgi:hypothetical protein
MEDWMIREMQAANYERAVWNDALKDEPLGTTFEELIAREKAHAEALRRANGRPKPEGG